MGKVIGTYRTFFAEISGKGIDWCARGWVKILRKTKSSTNTKHLENKYSDAFVIENNLKVI